MNGVAGTRSRDSSRSPSSRPLAGSTVARQRGPDRVAEQDVALRRTLGEPPGGGDRRAGRGARGDEHLAGLEADAQLGDLVTERERRRGPRAAPRVSANRPTSASPR